MNININNTDYTDAEIIAAVKSSKEVATADNHGTDGEIWQRIRYTMTIEMANGDMIAVCWNPTEEGYKLAEERDDDSYMCDWDNIDLVEYI